MRSILLCLLLGCNAFVFGQIPNIKSYIETQYEAEKNADGSYRKTKPAESYPFMDIELYDTQNKDDFQKIILEQAASSPTCTVLFDEKGQWVSIVNRYDSTSIYDDSEWSYTKKGIQVDYYNKDKSINQTKIWIYNERQRLTVYYCYSLSKVYNTTKYTYLKGKNEVWSEEYDGKNNLKAKGIWWYNDKHKPIKYQYFDSKDSLRYTETWSYDIANRKNSYQKEVGGVVENRATWEYYKGNLCKIYENEHTSSNKKTKYTKSYQYDDKDNIISLEDGTIYYAINEGFMNKKSIDIVYDKYGNWISKLVTETGFYDTVKMSIIERAIQYR